MKLALRLLTLVVAIHGTLLGAAALAGVRAEGPLLSGLVFWLLIAPALILAAPFNPLLWQLRMMEGSGWFAWPNASGFALVYTGWIVVLFAASFLFRRKT